MKVLIALSCLVVVSLASVLTMTHEDYEWNAWKAKYQKNYYDGRDEAIRRYIWGQNQKFVDQHNHEYNQGKHTFTVAMNKFADLDTSEFVKMFLAATRKGPINTPGCTNSSIYLTTHNYGDLPTEVDWRTKGYVTKVKDQGQCGSCWAFSTTGSLEGQHFKATDELVSLSEQNLMDCSKPEGDFSCEGGLMDNAFDYIIENGGVDTEASYPYEAADETKCRFSKANVGATASSCVDVRPSGDEDALKKAVGTVGPISVAIDAGHQSFQLYQSGVYSETECSTSLLDHGVLVVGYGADSGTDYWMVKNSWGVSWGMEGYIMMSRNAGNQCGIATSASYPIV